MTMQVLDEQHGSRCFTVYRRKQTAELRPWQLGDIWFLERWNDFYRWGCSDMHLTPETEAQMDARLNDWGRKGWQAAD